jgi:outer membrane receptor for ferrienterochelin and colicins
MRCAGAVSRIVLVCVLATWASIASADGVADEAELQFQLGLAAYQAADYTSALEHFLASNRLVPNDNVVYDIARTYERLGRPADAYRYYVDALAGDASDETMLGIAESVAILTPQLAIVDVETDPQGATIYVDRRDLGSVGQGPRSLALEPGTHTIFADVPGYRPAESAPFEVAIGQRVTVRIHLDRIVGHVAVTGDSGSTVRVDSEAAASSCTTPCALELQPGPHILYFAREGFREAPRQITVTAGAISTVEATLEALVGSLLVTADESNARVEVDDRTVGFTPAVVSGLSVGVHTVRVTATGYEPYEEEVTIEESEQTELRDVHLVGRREIQAASRRVERIDDAPASVTVLSAEELEAFSYPTLYDALRGVRGFALTQDSTYSNAAVRGLGQPNDYSNRLLVLSDGAVLNEDILYQPFIGYDGRVDLGDVERIEIVRGTGSVLYGTGAVSGVVNLVPHPRDEPTHADFQLSAVSSTVGRARASLTLRLADDTGLRLSVSGAHSEGRDVAMSFDADGDGVDDRNVAHGVDRFDAFTTTGRFFHEALTVQWIYTLRELGVPTGSFGSVFDRGDADRYDDQRAMLEVRFEPRLSDDVQLFTRVYGNYTYFHLDYLFPTEQTDPRTMRSFQQPYQETYHGLWFGGEARGVFQVVPELRLTGGIEVAHHPIVSMRSAQTELDEATGTFSTSVPMNVSRPFSVFSGYVLGDWEPVHELLVSAGARLDYWDNPQTGAPQEAPDFVSVNPRLALIFRLSPSDTLKVLGGRAFRAPSTYESLYTDQGVSTLASNCCGAVIQPETVYAGELEYTHHFDDDWSVLGSAHVQLAQMLIDSLVPPPPISTAFPDASYYGNQASDVLIYGADVVVRRELRNGWMFDFQAGALDARYLTTPAGASSDRVPNVPPLTGSIRGIVPIISRALQAAIRLSVEGQRRIDLTSTAETGWAAVLDFVLSGTVTEIGLRYSAGVYNVFDWQYPVPVLPFPSRTMPQAGRTFLLSLTLTI